MSKPSSKTVRIETSPAAKSKTDRASGHQPIQEIPRVETAHVVTPTHEEIAMRAYRIYVEKGCPEGQSDQIWQQAEQEIKNRNRTAILSGKQ